MKGSFGSGVRVRDIRGGGGGRGREQGRARSLRATDGGSLKARVRNGRLVLDEPTELPEGTELVLAVADEDHDMDDAERARLHESLRRSIAQAKAGQLIDGDEVIGRLLVR
jgi:hypothetical protein